MFKQAEGLRICGGNEFAAPGAEESVAPDAVRKLKQAAELLNYDIFMLSPSDMRVLRSANIKAPKAWFAPAATPRLLVKNVPEGSVAFVLFPDQGQADPEAEKNLVHFARQLRDQKKYNLIIGLSTWGSEREERFLQGNAPVFDIVLGSGDGPGYSGVFLHENQTLWMRAFTRGKNILTLALPTLPAPGAKVAWQPDVSAIATVVHLGDSIAPDPQVDALFRP